MSPRAQNGARTANKCAQFVIFFCPDGEFRKEPRTCDSCLLNYFSTSVSSYTILLKILLMYHCSGKKWKAQLGAISYLTQDEETNSFPHPHDI